MSCQRVGWVRSGFKRESAEALRYRGQGEAQRTEPLKQEIGAEKAGNGSRPIFGSVPWTTFRVPQTEGLGLGLRVYGSEFRVKGLGFRVSGLEFRV